MGEPHTGHRFNGAAWFEQQVRKRTRDALNARGSHASTRSAVYKAEYQRQLALFRIERAEVKQRKAEKQALRMVKRAKSQRDA